MSLGELSYNQRYFPWNRCISNNDASRFNDQARSARPMCTLQCKESSSTGMLMLCVTVTSSWLVHFLRSICGPTRHVWTISIQDTYQPKPAISEQEPDGINDVYIICKVNATKVAVALIIRGGALSITSGGCSRRFKKVQTNVRSLGLDPRNPTAFGGDQTTSHREHT